MTAFGVLAQLRDKPIPPPPEDGARGYRAIPIDMEGARNAEPLVRAIDFGVDGENYYAQARNPPYYAIIPGAIEELILRKGVAEKLRDVNTRIADVGLQLFVFDGWRPQGVQAYFHDTWLPNELRRRKPHLSEAKIFLEVENYWAAPSMGRDAPSPHSTGGAVDLTLRWRGGDPLWMGSLFDDASPIANTARLEDIDPDAFSFSDEEARANRRLLYWLMVDAGFASNPSEWWHYSFGDQMWAKLRGEPQAYYAGATVAGPMA